MLLMFYWGKWGLKWGLSGFGEGMEREIIHVWSMINEKVG